MKRREMMQCAALGAIAIQTLVLGPATAGTKDSNLQLVAAFMGNLVRGNLEAASEMMTPDGVVMFGRSTPSPANPFYGDWRGPAGCKAILELFKELIEPGKVDVTLRLVKEDAVILQGTLTHKARKTGKPFISDWALVVICFNGKIKEYKFYEDTAALELSLS